MRMPYNPEAHGADTMWVAQDKAGARKLSGNPTNQFFSEGNGGESRKSYHGYPEGNAQLIDSIEDFVMTPMQIDTWNRNSSYGEPYAPGPEPKSSQAPITGPDAIYSGHLECPCTDRIIKTVKHTYAT